MNTKSFEDLPVWQEAGEFVKTIYELTSLNKFYKRLRLKRSDSTSCGINYE